MLRDLPDPNHELLPHAPVELVVWQLQFAEPADVGSPEVGTKFADALADEHGPFQLQRLAVPTLVLPFPNSVQPLPTQIDPAAGWTLSRSGTVLTLNAQALSLETNRYETFVSFRAALERAITSLHETVTNLSESRLGLRYVDRLLHPGVRRPADWSALLMPWLTGPLGHPALGEAVAAYAQQIDFQPDSESIRATVRQRVFADAEQRGRETVILDYDVFREGYRAFDPEHTLEATDRMHDVAQRLFGASMTDSLRAVFAAPSEEQ